MRHAAVTHELHHNLTFMAILKGVHDNFENRRHNKFHIPPQPGYAIDCLIACDSLCRYDRGVSLESNSNHTRDATQCQLPFPHSCGVGVARSDHVCGSVQTKSYFRYKSHGYFRSNTDTQKACCCQQLNQELRMLTRGIGKP